MPESFILTGADSGAHSVTADAPIAAAVALVLGEGKLGLARECGEPLLPVGRNVTYRSTFGIGINDALRNNRTSIADALETVQPDTTPLGVAARNLARILRRIDSYA